MAEIMTGLAVVIAAVSAAVAIVARRDSARSAKAAEAALELERREVARQTELCDVRWERVNRGPAGLLAYRNCGTTSAYDVTVVVTINDERFEVGSDHVPGGDSIQYDASDLLGRAQREAANARSRARSSRPGVFYVPMTRFNVRARIAWKSELGTPSAQSIPADNPA